MVVREDLAPPAGVIVHVLDDERVVQVDHGRDRPRVCKEVIRGMPLNDRYVRLIAVLREGIRSDRRADAALDAAGIA